MKSLNGSFSRPSPDRDVNWLPSLCDVGSERQLLSVLLPSRTTAATKEKPTNGWERGHYKTVINYRCCPSIHFRSINFYLACPDFLQVSDTKPILLTSSISWFVWWKFYFAIFSRFLVTKKKKKMLLKFHLPLLKIRWYPEAHFRENYNKIEIFHLVVAEWGRGGEFFL